MKFVVVHSVLLFLITVSCQYSQTALTQEKRELLYLQVLFRHGDRAPITLYANDVNTETDWPEGLAKLTALGKRQHYVLGKFLRTMYNNFTTSSPNEVEILSSDVDRCLRSAAANLATFYAPDEKWRFEDNVDWQPFAIKYYPKDKDKLLETGSECPRAFEEQNRILNSPEGQRIIKDHWDMFVNVSKESGDQIRNWTEAAYLHDTILVEKKYNLSVPSWANAYWDQLENISKISFYWSYNSPLMLRLRAGPLIGLMIEKMKMKISGEIKYKKVQIYSCHDTNVAVFLHALNLYDMRPPPYCATVLLELYKATKNLPYAVRILYLNSSAPEDFHQRPHVLILEGCTEYCPLEYFINYTQNLIPGDWEAECQLSEPSGTIFGEISESGLIATLICLIIAFLIIILACIIFQRLQNQSRKEYSYHLMPTSQT